MDAPRDPKTSTGEMLKRLLEHILPKGIGEVVLSVKEAAGWMDGERGQLHMITMALSSHW